MSAEKSKLPSVIVPAHSKTIILFGCILNPAFLQPWDDTPPEIQAYWIDDATNAIPCEGSGDTGTYCFDCRYVSEIDIETE